MKRFAEGTSVPVARSREEISRLLAKHGVERQGWMTGPEGDQLGFELHGRPYRFSILRPTREWARANAGPRTYLDDAIDREWRRRWRANVLLLKAKLEFAEGDDGAIERELLPYLLTATGRTLGQLADEGAVAQAIDAPLLGDGR